MIAKPDDEEAKPPPLAGKTENIDKRFSTRPEITDPLALNAERIALKIAKLTISGFISQKASVANFRNIQYARIPGRWHESQMLHLNEQSGFIDATQWGPRAPQAMSMSHKDVGHLYPRMSAFDRQSEFECLNLNIYGPVNVLDGGKRKTLLPVLVYIHGGSFEFGDGGGTFDGQCLVKRSIDLGQPIIVVGLNYRLGALGFFTSEELRNEARNRGERGYSNLGFADQRVALQWIAKYISHFGGDGSRITLSGESAGAISVLAHLRGNVPTCHNALILSLGSVTPVSHSIAQRTFDNVVEKIGLSSAPVAAKIAALRSLPAEEIQQLSTNRTETILSEDPEFFSDYAGQRFEELTPIPSWVTRVVLGDSKDENGPFSKFWRKVSPQKLTRTWMELYGEDIDYGNEVFHHYGLKTTTIKDVPGTEVVEAIVKYTSDALFSFATKTLTSAYLSGPQKETAKLYQYRFDQPDLIAPTDGFRGRAYHSMINAFLFYHPAVSGYNASTDFKATSVDLTDCMLRLLYDLDPWESLEIANRFRIFEANNGRLANQSESFEVRWISLADTPARRDKFLLGKDLLWKTVTLAMEKIMSASSESA